MLRDDLELKVRMCVCCQDNKGKEHSSPWELFRLTRTYLVHLFGCYPMQKNPY